MAAVMFARCGGPNTEKMADVDPVLWEAGTPVRMEVASHDTVGFYRLYIPLMFNENFDRAPVGFTLAVTAPDGTRMTEEIAIRAFQNACKHGGLYQMSHPYRDSVRLGRDGAYVFEISPLRDIAGFKSIGIDIVKIINGQE